MTDKAGLPCYGHRGVGKQDGCEAILCDGCWAEHNEDAADHEGKHK